MFHITYTRVKDTLVNVHQLPWISSQALRTRHSNGRDVGTPVECAQRLAANQILKGSEPASSEAKAAGKKLFTTTMEFLLEQAK
jgi:hypothetical protein